jgi:hypothetical protein
MRGPVAVALAVLSMTLGAGLVACFDLFHSTGDVLTACQVDAQTPGCRADAGAVDAEIDAATDFCTWPESEARANAQSACAWLGACETPLGRNAFGACMFAALLAYDCHANPDHPVKGKAHAIWDCLWQARTCGAVDTCVFPQGRPRCGGGPFVACATQDGGPPNADVRVECPADGGTPTGENCALWGQTCGGDLSEGVCAGSAGAPAIGCALEGGSCMDTALHWCASGYDVGIDCADNGARGCKGFSTATDAEPAAWVACQPQGEGATCQPDASARCDNGVAVSCPAGTVETLDCAALLLQNAQGCTPGMLTPPFDWTSPCQVVGEDAGEGGTVGDGGDMGDASPCTDSCMGGTMLNGCYRGASFSLDCMQVGLGPCQIVQTDVGRAFNAACTPRP